MRVVISGMTAAGKSTHGRILAAELDVPFISATEILARLVAERTGGAPEKRWQPSLDAARGADPTIDEELDAVLAETFRSVDSGVFDACLLPWVVPDVTAVRVWIDSDRPSRLRKCVVSHWDEGIGLALARERVDAKDAFTVARLRETSGADYLPEGSMFDVVASNTSLIPVATPEAAAAGIAAFSPVLGAAVRHAAGLDADLPLSPWLLRTRPGTGK